MNTRFEIYCCPSYVFSILVKFLDYVHVWFNFFGAHWVSSFQNCKFANQVLLFHDGLTFQSTINLCYN
jgi:hypothetical protein